jgi:hypothetical protein
MCLDNFKTREISRGAHKLTWTPIFKKKMCLDNNIQVLVLLPYISANISSITCSKKKKHTRITFMNTNFVTSVEMVGNIYFSLFLERGTRISQLHC